VWHQAARTQEWLKPSQVLPGFLLQETHHPHQTVSRLSWVEYQDVAGGTDLPSRRNHSQPSMDLGTNHHESSAGCESSTSGGYHPGTVTGGYDRDHPPEGDGLGWVIQGPHQCSASLRYRHWASHGLIRRRGTGDIIN